LLEDGEPARAVVVVDRFVAVARFVSAAWLVVDGLEKDLVELFIDVRPVLRAVEPVARGALARPVFVLPVRDVLPRAAVEPVARDAVVVRLVPRVVVCSVVGLRMAVVAPRTMEGRAVVVGVRARMAVVVLRRIPLVRGVVVDVGRAIPVAPPRVVPRPVVAVEGVRMAVVVPRTMLAVRAGPVRMAAPDRPAKEVGFACSLWAARAAW
jgi:sec-independent protein translocase protein tatB-like protein